MTTRDEARRRIAGGRGTGRDRTTIPSEPQPSLPERLLAAREAKGVDLYRAEHDTKIRARYLRCARDAASIASCTAQIYTEGLLRNYALYLGLDPDEILVQSRQTR